MQKKAAVWAWRERRTPVRRRVLLFCAVIAVASSRSAQADDATDLIRNSFGGPGLIDMPSARMAADGTLSAGADFTRNTQHYNFGFQVTPWLETSFRYSGLQHFDTGYPTYYDRSFAAKLRLADETDMLPAIAIGINDVVGTGIYSSEYLVASKRFGPVDATLGMGWGRLADSNLFANPLGLIDQSFKVRRSFGTPGATNFNTLFHGPDVGLFGGLVWHTPVDGLSLIAEYSSDQYELERTRGTFPTTSQFNFGAYYHVNDQIAFGLDWLYGRSLGGNITISLDPVHDSYRERMGAPLPEPAIRMPSEQQQALANLNRARAAGLTAPPRPAFNYDQLVDALWRKGDAFSGIDIDDGSLVITLQAGSLAQTCRTAAMVAGLYDMNIRSVRVTDGRRSQNCAVTHSYAMPTPIPASYQSAGLADIAIIDARTTASPNPQIAQSAIRAALHDQGIPVEAIAITETQVTVYYANTLYFSEKDAAGRIVRVLMTKAPPGVEKFRLIETQDGVPQRTFDLLRGPLERSYTQLGRLDWDNNAVASFPALQNPVLAAAERRTYPRLSWSVFPQFRQQLFDPVNPFGVQVLGAVSGRLDVLPGLSLNAEAEASIWDNFNTQRLSNSLLPHVRTDFVQYFTQGKNGLGDLEADYRFRLAPGVFAIARAGYLESMFAGGGGEILWRPENQRWALGVDAYEVWQRNFDRLLGLQPYHVFTGHVSLYYASPWYDLNFVLRAGQYLAGDKGLTLEVTRRFASGVEVGAFMTKTNVSAARFGEGSFDKGIMIRIPIGWILPINTQTEWNMALRPVQRDGGQQLDGDTLLYEETRRASIAEMSNSASEP